VNNMGVGGETTGETGKPASKLAPKTMPPLNQCLRVKQTWRRLF
jgi:hypothetical protein